MTTLFFTWLVISLSIASLLLAEFWAEANNSRSVQDIVLRKGNVLILNTRHLSGIFVFLICCWSYAGSPGHAAIFSPALNPEWIFITVVIVLITITTGYFSAGNICRSQAIRAENIPFNSGLLICILLRVLFLILYECFFRGVLLFTLLPVTGPFIAISINVILYALVHCRSSRNEIFGTIPFGILLCIITLAHQSVWPAVIIHLALALSHEIRLVFYYQSSIKPQQS